MRLRNKKTGEIIELEGLIQFDAEDRTYEVPSIEAFNEEWEDYEEPKNYWMIDGHGEAHEIFVDSSYISDEKEIGNYFETKEEAKRAVEKLKAWKRLKDNHFKFLNVKNITPDVPIDKYYVHIEAKFDGAGLDDMRLLFGGEE